MKRTFTIEEALKIGEQINVDFDEFDLEQFRKGLSVELEHGAHDLETNVTNDSLPMTGKIAWAHLKELPDYYTRLEKMEYELNRKDAIVKRLYLSEDKKVMGVCGGIAEYFETDPSLVRLAWIVLTILTGIVPGIIAYFIAGIVIPSHKAEEPTRDLKAAHNKA